MGADLCKPKTGGSECDADQSQKAAWLVPEGPSKTQCGQDACGAQPTGRLARLREVSCNADTQEDGNPEGPTFTLRKKGILQSPGTPRPAHRGGQPQEPDSNKIGPSAPHRPWSMEGSDVFSSCRTAFTDVLDILTLQRQVP